jgi:hypothetical protein
MRQPIQFIRFPFLLDYFSFLRLSPMFSTDERSDAQTIQEALSRCESASQRFLAVAGQALATSYPNVCFDRYYKAIEAAAETSPPPFCKRSYNNIYQYLAKNPRWLAISLMANAQREGQGSTDLWSLAACAKSFKEQKLLKKHAIDESRHSQMYLSLLDLNFPGLVETSFRKEMNAFSPGFNESKTPEACEESAYAKDPSLDDYVQINIAEIRTTFHHLMQRQALSKHCPPGNVISSSSVLDALLRDELNHVAYTAQMIEANSSCIPQDKLNILVTKRLVDFNKITEEELKSLSLQ